MGIPLPLLSSPRGLAGGREEEEDFLGKKKKKKARWGPWEAECPSAPARSGLGISSGVHRHGFPFQAIPPRPLLK